jgi:hypothetical protein
MKTQRQERLGLAAALTLLFMLLFFSLFKNAQIQSAVFHVGFDPKRLGIIWIPVALTLVIGAVFLVAEFSFGYLVGFYLFAMMAGYFWLNVFSLLPYDHERALLCAVVSIACFLLPALTIRNAPDWLKRLPLLPATTPELILGFAASVLAIAAVYGFQFAGLDDMERIRGTITRPAVLNYLIGNVIGALIPFAFACFLLQRRWAMVAAACALSLLYYPVTLSKIPLLMPAFLCLVALASRWLQARLVVVVSLLVPLCVALAPVLGRDWDHVSAYGLRLFSILSFRFLAVPAVALDHYYAFFAANPQTWFCQIGLLKPFMTCPYDQQLSLVLSDAYGLGNLNASMFATEGVASVGLLYAPLVAALCGMMIGLGNVAASGLPPRFVLISGTMIAVMLRDVPLSVTFLTNGYGLLLLLWLIAPERVRPRSPLKASRSPAYLARIAGDAGLLAHRMTAPETMAVKEIC